MNKTVMIVDDCDAIRLTLSCIVHSWGHNTICAFDGAHAQSILSYRAPDFIITDLNMPSMDGLALISWIKSRPWLTGIPILMMSSDCLTTWEVKALNAGATACLPKAMKPAELHASLYSLIESAPDAVRPSRAPPLNIPNGHALARLLECSGQDSDDPCRLSPSAAVEDVPLSALVQRLLAWRAHPERTRGAPEFL